MAHAIHHRIDKAQLHQVNQLIKDVEIIEHYCVGTKARNDEESKLDEFQRNKHELNQILTKVKQEIKTKKGMEQRIGTNTESIKLKSHIRQQLNEAKQLQIRMETAYNMNQSDFDNGDGEISDNEIKTRQELVSLMSQDLEYTQNEFEPKTDDLPDTISFRLAQRSQKRRQQQQDQGLIPSKVHPLTTKQQQFIQESIQRDALLDRKLVQIKNQVIILRRIGDDVTNALDLQGVMLDEVEVKMDDVTERLEKRNEQIETLLHGGAPRWCPVLILCVILMACIGYIYNTFIA